MHPFSILLLCFTSFLGISALRIDKALILNDLLVRTVRLRDTLRQATAELEANRKGNRHLDIEVVSQTAWINFYIERIAKVDQKKLKLVELHLLQEALLRRENRLEEELEIIKKVQENFKPKHKTVASLLEHIQGRLVKYLEVYKRVPNVYRQVVWGAIDELKHMIEELKDPKKALPNKEKLVEWEQIVARIDETMKNTVKYRIHSTIHDREFYN